MSPVEAIKKIREIAETIQIQLLEKGYIIHRYDAFSSNSVYLKVDYGVGGSIRISNHKGKKNLSYRFNIFSHQEGTEVNVFRDKVCDRHFYQANAVQRLINDVIKFREGRVRRYGGLNRYQSFVEKAKNENQSITKGFWKNAKEVKLQRKSPKPIAPSQ